MNHYIDALEAQLRSAADRQAERDHANAQRRRVASGIGAVGATAGITVAFALSGGTEQAAALPLLDRPAVDAQALAGELTVVRAAGADLSQARTFDTPDGRGFAFVTDDGKAACLAVPDATGYGQVCGAVNDVERRGLTLELTRPKGENGSGTRFFAVVPDQATVSERREDGRSAAIEPDRGIVQHTVSSDASIVIATPKGSSTYPVTAAEPENNQYRDCGQGRIVPLTGGRTAENACR